jgi:uncharacterized protein YndB with AHSA1/START domain
MVGAAVDGHDAAFVRAGRAHRRQVPPRVRRRPSEPDGLFGEYLDVVPNQRIVWTNEESGADGSVTTVTFEEKNGKTTLVISEIYPTKEALDAAGTGAQEAMVETFGQLDELLASLTATAARS